MTTKKFCGLSNHFDQLFAPMFAMDHKIPFVVRSGSIPLLVSIPHNGSYIPAEIADRMTVYGQRSVDTDWFLDRLYDIPELATSSSLIAEFSRYMVDLNRPMDDEPLYHGQGVTGLIPEFCFDGNPIYRSQTPGPDEFEIRIDQIWKPYHRWLQSELDRLRDAHGVAVVVDAHSIKSVVPRLFDGVLPDFSIGTNHHRSCDATLTAAVGRALSKQRRYTHVINGRFIGGYITRHYGDPLNNVHALQIELSQATYMNEESLQWNADKASQVQPVITSIIQAVIEWIHKQI